MYAHIPNIGNRVSTVEGVKQYTITLDANGNKIQSTDHGGTINYSYDANNNLIQTNYDGILLTMGYDHWGRKTSLNDPSAGLYTYSYNIYGDLLNETTPKRSKSYQYDNLGLVETKTVVDNSNINETTTYEYDANSKKLVEQFTVNNNTNDSPFGQSFAYDSNQNLTWISEFHNSTSFQKTFTYDAFGRLNKTVFFANALFNGLTSATTIHYDYQNGYNHQMREGTNTTPLIKTTNINARGQVTNLSYQNNINVTNTYNQFGFITNSLHRFGTTSTGNRVNLTSNFDNQRGNLLSRTYDLFGVNTTESFQYDNLDRLTHYPSATGTIIQQTYDVRGRITANEIGAYNYENTIKPYQNTSITLNTTSHNYYNPRPNLNISYNIHKAPIDIHEPGLGRYSFAYDGDGNRIAAFYGNEDADVNNRPIKKFYSSDGTFEVVTNTTTGTTEIFTYIEGDPYTANFVKKTTTSGSEFLYLHKDYLGSILAISNQAGTVIEKRHFDAWGNLTKYWKTGGSTTLPNGTNTFLLLDRGYTGHEHLLSVGLVHLNGRLYDPKLHRFLMPDNYVQDPSNTQNYNRYSYVLNNPLRYTDPSGEEFLTTFLVTMAVATLFYVMDCVQNNQPITFKGITKMWFLTAIGSVATFGIGSAVAAVSTNFWVQTGVAAIGHGILQGGMSALHGGKFWGGFANGAISSIVSSFAQGPQGGKVDGEDVLPTGAGKNIKGFIKGEFGTVAFSTLSGGVSASIGGGNFWKGAAQGMMVSMMNHVAHAVKKKFKYYAMLDEKGANGGGHQAGAGELENGKIRFQSLNGTLDENDANIIGPSNFTDQEFNSLEEIQKFYGTVITPGHKFNKIDVYMLTKSQMNRALNAAYFIGKQDYHLIFNNCASLVTSALSAAFNRKLFLFDITPRINQGLQRFNYYSNYKYSLKYSY